MTRRRSLAYFGLTALLAACGSEEDLDLARESEELVFAASAAGAANFHTLESQPGRMHLAFSTSDPTIATVAINRMDKDEGYYKRLDGLPLVPGGQYVYDDTTATLGKEYCYVVLTRQAGQSQSTQSQARCAVHNGGSKNLPPTAPTDLAINKSYERALRVAYTDTASHETGFSLERQMFGLWLPIKDLPASPGTGAKLTVTDTDLDLEETYCYRIRALGANGSTVSWSVCGKTLPLAAVEHVAVEYPILNTIVHPQTGALQVRWSDHKPGQRDWKVYTFDSPLQEWPVHVAHVSDDRPVPSPLQAADFTGLDPGKLYCFAVTRASESYRWPRICERPKQARYALFDRDPRPEVTPRIVGIEASNRSVSLEIENPQPNAYLEGVKKGVRYTIGTAPGDTAYQDGLTPGETYCYRLVVFNHFGARYSDLACATTSSEPPGSPRNLTGELVNDKLYMDWDSGPRAEHYEVEWHGERDGYVDHDGDRTVTSTGTDILVKEGYSYCVKVRAVNAFGSSPWVEACDFSVPDDHLVTYSASMEADVPPTGNVIWRHIVNAGVGPTAHLVTVEVVSGGSEYKTQFLPAGSTREDCNTDTGVILEPGQSLTPAHLNQLYGSSSPTLPLELLGCKLYPGPVPQTLPPIIVNVTYQQ